MAINGINGLRYVGVGIQKAAERLSRNMSLIRFSPGEIEMNFCNNYISAKRPLRPLRSRKRESRKS